MKYNSSVILCGDVRKSHEFYSGTLGLEVLMDNGAHVAYKCGLSLWDREMAQKLVLGGQSDSSGMAFELCFESDAINDDFEKLKAAGCEILTELSEQPWGQLVFRIRDFDGHIIEFGEKLSDTIKRFRSQGFTDSEISVRTHIPAELLNSI